MVGFPIHAAAVVAAVLTLLLFLLAAFWPLSVEAGQRLPIAVRVLLPAMLCVPYVMVAVSYGQFRWSWFALYLLLPVVISWLLYRASIADAAQRGDWRDLLVLVVLGLAVDLRWFEPAWPPRLAVFNKMLLLDAGIYGFLAIRRLQGVGFDLRLRLADLRIGLRELLFYAPIGIVVGLLLGFLHFHATLPTASHVVSGLDLHLFLCCSSRGAIFSRVDAESSGAPPRAAQGVVGDRCSLRALALQQTRSALQLAIRCARSSGWGVLWAGLASGAAGGCVGDHPCVGRYSVVALAAVIGWVF